MLRAALLSLLFLFVSQQMMAQNRTITGSVSDEKNNPIPGVSIAVKGSTLGTAADAKGNFTITVPASAKTLVISSVGYLNQEITIGGKTSFVITLISPSQALIDVVVIGYGTAKKKDLTGAISTISSKDLNQGPITNPLQQIAGRASGVSVTQTGREPGTGPGIRIGALLH